MYGGGRQSWAVLGDWSWEQVCLFDVFLGGEREEGGGGSLLNSCKGIPRYLGIHFFSLMK